MKITDAIRTTAAEMAAMSQSDETIDHHQLWIWAQRIGAQLEAFERGLMEGGK